MKLRSLFTAVAAVGCLTLGSATAAVAQTAVVVDGDDSAIRADVLRVKIANRSAVKVKVTFDDLRLSSPSQSASLYLDTDPGAAGPELALVAGLNRGTDYALLRVVDWGAGR
jgi:hypothetical protein